MCFNTFKRYLYCIFLFLPIVLNASFGPWAISALSQKVERTPSLVSFFVPVCISLLFYIVCIAFYCISCSCVALTALYCTRTSCFVFFWYFVEFVNYVYFLCLFTFFTSCISCTFYCNFYL